MSSTGQAQDTTTAAATATTTTPTTATGKETTTTGHRHRAEICLVCLFFRLFATVLGWLLELLAVLHRQLEAYDERERLARRRQRARINIARMSAEVRRDQALQAAWGRDEQQLAHQQRVWLEEERLRGYKEAWEREKAALRSQGESAPAPAPAYKGKGKEKAV